MKIDKKFFETKKFSFSSINTFETCPHSFYLTYIDKEERADNYFSDYGLLMHDLLEKFWSQELEVWDLSSEFERRYHEEVLTPPPQFIRVDGYLKGGLKFFNEFNLNIDNYDVLGNEFTIFSEHKDIKMTIRPDLIIRDRRDGKVILVDYKSSNIFTPKGRVKKGKLPEVEKYFKQLSLYAYFVEKEMGVEIDILRVYFPRTGDLDNALERVYTKDMGKNAIEWVESNVQKIKGEERFPPKQSEFFCKNICGVRNSCLWKD